MDNYSLDVVVTRGGTVESRHRVHAAVVDAAGRLIGSAGDPATVAFCRSCAKPFQVMPFVAAGGVDKLGWGEEQIAIACGSHGGEPEHVALAEAMLADIGLEEGDLACGVHEPLTPRGVRMAHESGTMLSRLHNNCSGKHAAMLARAHAAGWPTSGYERGDHPVQRSVVETVSKWTDVPESDLHTAIDGCGVPVFALPLEQMARSYARLASAAHKGDEVPARIINAMVARPFLVGGTERFDSIIIEETDGAIVSKVGAEGVHCAAIPGMGLGVAIKVEDGSQRAQYPAIIRLLQQLKALPDRLPQVLADLVYKPVRNTRNAIVGEIAPLS